VDQPIAALIADLKQRGLIESTLIVWCGKFGMVAVEGKAHVRDFHVTLLRLLGLDDNKLTYYHAGRFKQLSQFGGTLIKELIA
jgi:hypothetical protein